MEARENRSALHILLKILFVFLAVTSLLFATETHTQAAAEKSLKAPTLESVKNKSSSVKLQWTKVSKAGGYTIYRKQGSGSYKKIATINSRTKVTYKDKTVKSGKVYTYKVRAFNKKTNTKSKCSSAVKIRYLQSVSIKSAKSNGNCITLSWDSTKGAGKYKIYRKSGNGSYKLLKTVDSSVTSYKDKSITYNKTYTYKIRAYRGSYHSYGTTISAKAKASIETVTSKYAIEADVSLTGAGSGYHAKIAIVAPESAVSFGIQYDKGAPAPYTGKSFFLVENIHSNNSGGQAYWRVKSASLGTSYKLLLTLSSSGTCKIYVDGLYLGKVTNTEIVSQPIYLRVEGAAKVNGDYVNASFSNIKLKSGTYNAKRSWTAYDMRNLSPSTAVDVGIYSDISQFASSKRVNIRGMLKGIASWQDWDSAYNAISGVVQFQ